MKNLTPEEAYDAMRLFLENYRIRVPSDEVSYIVSWLAPFKDGKLVDPAIWPEWLECLETARHLAPKDRVRAG